MRRFIFDKCLLAVHLLSGGAARTGKATTMAITASVNTLDKVDTASIQFPNLVVEDDTPCPPYLEALSNRVKETTAGQPL
jgi:hypothetical protein